jgi:hypothetical protein
VSGVVNKKVVNDDPRLFLMISRSYSSAAKSVWDTNFGSKARADWDWSLLIHPLSQLLGIAFETALKGLLIFRNGHSPATHNLKDLMLALSDNELEDQLTGALSTVDVQQIMLDTNPGASRDELEALYRRHHLHIETLNLLYDRPFASRYPVDNGKDGVNLFDPVAAYLMITVVQGRLSQELSE